MKFVELSAGSSTAAEGQRHEAGLQRLNKEQEGYPDRSRLGFRLGANPPISEKLHKNQ